LPPPGKTPARCRAQRLREPARLPHRRSRSPRSGTRCLPAKRAPSPRCGSGSNRSSRRSGTTRLCAGTGR
jgi:hypothetical protein